MSTRLATSLCSAVKPALLRIPRTASDKRSPWREVSRCASPKSTTCGWALTVLRNSFHKDGELPSP